ncbi:MAG: ABC transporter substrate-binding protein, partial [Propionibacteriaceae bacterium]
VILNTKRGVLQDVRARQAINYALDRQGYASLMHDTAKPTFVFFPENVAFGGEADRKTTASQKDLAKAKSLFLELGYTEENGVLVKDGNPLTLKVVTYPMRPYLGQLAQLLQSDMRSIGVTITIDEMKSTADVMKAGDYDLGMYSMGTAPSGDPEYFFDTMLRSTSTTNYCHYTSATFDSALDKLSNTVNHDERIKASHAAEQVLLDELPYIIVGHQQWWAVSNASVKDLEIRPTEYHLLSAKTSVQK